MHPAVCTMWAPFETASVATGSGAKAACAWSIISAGSNGSLPAAVSAVAIGLFLGGALGNGLDRLLRAPGPLHGGVVDWLAPGAHAGSMNLADLALNAAVVLLVAGALLSMRSSRGGRAARGAPSR